MFAFTPFSFIVAGAFSLAFLSRSHNFFVATCSFFSVFQAAAVFNIKIADGYYIGIQPGYFLALAVLPLLIYRARLDNSFYSRYFKEAVSVYTPLLIFGGYSLFSLAFPFIFMDNLYVNPPRGGISSTNLALLRPALTNLSQAGYLSFNIVFAFFVSLEISKNARLARFMIIAYLVSGAVVLASALLQLLSAHTQVYNPVTVLYSNLGYSQLFFQAFGDIKRLNATFTEPSLLAFYLTGYYAFSLWSFLSTAKFGYIYISVFSGMILLLTTSASGYAGFFVVSIFALCVAAKLHVRILRQVFFSVLLAFLGAFLGFRAQELAGNLKAQELAGNLKGSGSRDFMVSGLIQKGKSQSGSDRFSTDMNSLRLLPKSYGFGAGIGSTRSSSLLTNILGNLGIPGFLISIYTGYAIIRRLRRGGLKFYPTEENHLTGGITVSIAASLFVGMISVPDLNPLFLWNLLAILMGLMLCPACAISLGQQVWALSSERRGGGLKGRGR